MAARSNRLSRSCALRRGRWHCTLRPLGRGLRLPSRIRDGGARRPRLAPTVGVLIGATLVAAGCAPVPDVIVTDNDRGGRVHLRTGQLVNIVLADDYDETGCQWREYHTPQVLELLGSLYQPQRTPAAGTGNGTHTARYRVIDEGTAAVSLVESDNGDRVCRRFEVTVMVR